MRTRIAFLVACLLLPLLLAGCKPPRPPHEAAVGSVSGEWSAQSVATTRPRHAGEMLWRMLLEEEQAGNIRGRGSLSHAGGSSSFSVDGVRGEGVISFDLRMEDGEQARFEGSVMDVRTIVGRVHFREDTIPVTFTRG